MSLDNSTPRRPGRPRIHAPDAERVQVNVRVSREEADQMRRAADAAGMTVSAWARVVLMEAAAEHTADTPVSNPPEV